MAETVQRIVVLGSTLTALALVRQCRALSIDCMIVQKTPGPASDSRIPQIIDVADASDGEILQHVVALATEKRSILVADSDGWLRWLMRHRPSLDDAFASVFHPPNDVLTLCLDKTRFLIWCQQEQLSAPRVYASDPSYDDIDFPVLVRPQETRHGSADGLPKAIEVNDRGALASLLDRYRAVGAKASISQSLLRPNIRQYSVGLARNSRGQAAIIVCEKMRPSAEMCAGGTYVVPRPAGDVEAFATEVATRLGYFGIAEIEILKDLDSEEMFLIEVNARPWVQYSLAWRCGYDFMTFLMRPDDYDAALERPSGPAWISFRDDLYVVFSRSEGMLSRGKISIATYVASLFNVRVFALWSWRDQWPAIKAMIRGLRFFGDRRK